MNASSFYSQTWDTIILGAGYAGFAAALSRQNSAEKILLIDRRAALLPESGWSFASETGNSNSPLWKEWITAIESRDACRKGHIDGAIAEISANACCLSKNLPVLGYVAPVSAEITDNLLHSLIVTGKSGLHRLSAARWIDATDSGELTFLLDQKWRQPTPASQMLTLCFRFPKGKSHPLREWTSQTGSHLCWRPGMWPDEQCLEICWQGDKPDFRKEWIPALQSLHETVDMRHAVLTHGSTLPFSAYSHSDQTARLPGNVLFAGANGSTLAGKFDVGIQASHLLETLPSAPPSDTRDTPILLPSPLHVKRAEVAVAGLGTGGAVAALAAAREGASVLAFERMPFPGGIGSGGGFHVYYFGEKGGLQEEIDEKVRSLMPLFCSSAQVSGFHPDAKKIVLENLLEEAGVRILYDSILAAVSAHDGVLESSLVATPQGLAGIHAGTWIDATGDGDLAALAGAPYRLGRKGDGLLHAYSQAAGKVVLRDEIPRMEIVNFDAGYCDPTDEEDLSRGRMTGIVHYLEDHFRPDCRPTYLAPALGLRQSRQIETEYTLTLDDLITRRTFPDAIGYTGGHYDNHARDYEFESDDAAFWVWVCQQWYGRLACEIPYRLLIPKNLKNITLACRAVGVSEEAHPSFRMQRDIQRIGEAAGIGSALAARNGRNCATVPYESLRSRLFKSGALIPKSITPHPPALEAIDGWIRELHGGPATEALWHLYRAGSEARPHVLPLLESPDDTVSWRAAAILAMWNDPLAEKRLLHAIRRREDDKTRDIRATQQEWFYVPRWYAALTLLKRCITPDSLPTLEELATDAGLPLNLRNAVALAAETLARQPRISPETEQRLALLLDRLLASSAPHARRRPDGPTLGPDTIEMSHQHGRRPVEEDYLWQLQYAVARARRALGLPLQKSIQTFRQDPRALVRRALARIEDPPSCS